MPDAGAGEIDLALLAIGYDHRAAGEGDRKRARIAAGRAGLGVGDVAVDVGGGRGAHAGVFAATGAIAIVADRSPSMAAHAKAAGVHAVVADGQRLPIRDRLARLVYFHLAIHHGDPELMIGEAARVALPGGLVWIWTLDHGHHRVSFLARWFPSVGAIDERRFPHPVALARTMARVGLEVLPSLVVEEPVTRTAGSWEDAVRSGFVSTLQLIPAAELAAGLDRFRRAHPDPAEEISYSLSYRSVAGTARERNASLGSGGAKPGASLVS